MDRSNDHSQIEIIHIVDFDGTIYRGNSFHDWIKFLLFEAVCTGRPKLICKVLAAVFRRIARSGHSEFKKTIQSLWLAEIRTEQRVNILRRFNQWQIKRLRHELIQEIRQIGGFVLVTTAAPCEYMEGLKDIVGFDALLCTRYHPDPGWNDNSRLNKLRGVREWLKTRVGENRATKILYTDHADDFPLLEIVNEVVFVGSIAQTGVNIIRKKFPSMPHRVVT